MEELLLAKADSYLKVRNLKAIKKAVKKQLKYFSKNLTSIALLIKNGARLETLSKRQYKMLLVVSEVYRQQQWMFENNKQRIEERIVSLS